ncbi:hypothetical protein, partial [Liquorilactobacillus nagelii]|uniref:hypothetical protein n=1 Tax=Liquorilactobacillus nagelii TaxID=82688 RepID=UPI00311FE23E
NFQKFSKKLNFETVETTFSQELKILWMMISSTQKNKQLKTKQKIKIFDELTHDIKKVRKRTNFSFLKH